MRHLMLLAILFLGVTWVASQALAQTQGNTTNQGTGSDQSGQASESTQGNSTHSSQMGQGQNGMGQTGEMGNNRQMTQSGQTNTGAKTTVEGCLSGSNGSYMLTDSQGKSYQLQGDTSKLANHVNHEVRVTGTESAAGAPGANSMSNGAGGSEITLDVTSVKHVSKTCKNAGAGGTMSH